MSPFYSNPRIMCWGWLRWCAGRGGTGAEGPVRYLLKVEVKIRLNDLNLYKGDSLELLVSSDSTTSFLGSAVTLIRKTLPNC